MSATPQPADERADLFKRAEMRWMSMEDADITVRARLVAEIGRDLVALTADLRAKLRDATSNAYVDFNATRAEAAEARVAALETALREIGKMAGLGESGTGATGWIATLKAPEIARAALASPAPDREAE